MENDLPLHSAEIAFISMVIYRSGRDALLTVTGVHSLLLNLL
ncbi:hypothetical protein Syn1_218 [Prochlorococcus phage Syn1]|uniref:Uncharacterized protein n=1 Tax=Prochlorococcus phage Syn1 TaxID=444861 RepID=E3SPU9_9CAUD|nr:hypothetical protein Syn1_218 [Prochlorococcus phage Syn1]ADO99315.1 hypothetical protein Syn1_218 [Prochlorococcus phage Syn1]